jgi:hypothetical protein
MTTENVNHRHRNGKAGIDILHRAVAPEALFNSAERFPQPRCHPGTRTKMLDDLYNWATSDNSVRPIRWLHGPGGSGKSVIMQTLSQKLQDAGCLGGTFFKRGHSTRGNAKALFPTLAYQLALNNDRLKPLISASVEQDPSVASRHLEEQLHKLILEPSKSLRDSAPLILVIDALDECDTQDAVEILRLIGRAANEHPNTFRFLIASRPEPHICETLNKPSFHGILDSLNVEQSFGDIEKYLCDEFARIHREHRDTMAAIPVPWPSSDILDSLVQKSSGYFIYASTVIKFIDEKYSRPTERLAAIQNRTPTDSDAPFGALDQVYTEILSRVPAQYRSKLCDTLQCAILFDFGIKLPEIERLFEFQPGEVQSILRGLESLLEYTPTGHISVYHASFLDFLQDPQRSSSFFIGQEQRMNVARAVLKQLSDDNYWRESIDNPLTRYVGSLSQHPLPDLLCWVGASLHGI